MPPPDTRQDRSDAYDADTSHPWAAAYRIPITGTHPRWRYEVALVGPTQDSYTADLWRAVMPTEPEAQIVGSYIDFRRSWYDDHWAQGMLARPFDVDDGTNTVILLRTVGRWAYARASWTSGPPFVPSPNPTPDAAGLIALLDHVNRDSATWGAWKAKHPDLFPITA